MTSTLNKVDRNDLVKAEVIRFKSLMAKKFRLYIIGASTGRQEQ